jgi:hypothetical protein
MQVKMETVREFDAKLNLELSFYPRNVVFQLYINIDC